MVNIKQKKKQSAANHPKTRKELRKAERKMKKQRRLEYYTNRRKPGKYVMKPAEEIPEQEKQDVRKKSKSPIRPIKHKNGKNMSLHATFEDINMERKQQRRLEKDMQRQRVKQLIEANTEEDRNIKRLEKQLKLHKRKSKSIPSTFASEGLDYILEVCDADNLKDVATREAELNISDSEFDEDFALMSNLPIKKSIKQKELDKQIAKENDKSNDDASSTASENVDNDKSDDGANSVSSDHSDNDLDSEDSGNEKSEEEVFTSDEQESDNDSQIISVGKKRKLTANDCPKKKLKTKNTCKNESNVDNNLNDMDNKKGPETWEDIYGRLRGKDGSVLSNIGGKYIPPAIRAKLESESPNDKKRAEKLSRLRKQLKGLLNRLAEANMHNISTQIEELYMNNSRNDMNDTIANIMLESLVMHVITPERLLIEHVVLITILHANVGTEVGAHFLHAVVKQFDSFFDSEHEVENKKLDNSVAIISQLYNFKVVHSKLVYDVLSKLSSRFDEKSVECILLILKSVGFSLRKDDPLALKGLILDLQKQASNVSEETKENLRVKYMLDTLLAIKNNNMSKIPNYDTSYSEHLKKLQKNFIRKGNYVTQLNISLDDLLQADERGRWWIVGSAWSGAKEESNAENETIDTEKYSQKLLGLARKQRMNTDTRRNIFCIIMSAEDFIDAFEKLLRLGLKNQQEREIIHVLLHCCLQEKVFNPYYAVLAQKFCECDRKYQMIIKCSVWDKVRALTDCSASQISNLAKLLTHLFLEKGLPISTLKVLQFSELDKITLRFMRQILLGVLLCDETETCTAVFDKVAQSEKLKMFRESLRLFIHHFLLKNLKTDKVPEEKKSLLKTRCDLIEKMLTVNDKKIRF